MRYVTCLHPPLLNSSELLLLIMMVNVCEQRYQPASTHSPIMACQKEEKNNQLHMMGVTMTQER